MKSTRKLTRRLIDSLPDRSGESWDDLWPGVLGNAVRFGGLDRIERVLKNLRDMPEFPAELLCAIHDWNDDAVKLLLRYASSDWVAVCPEQVLDAVAAIDDSDARARVLDELVSHVHECHNADDHTMTTDVVVITAVPQVVVTVCVTKFDADKKLILAVEGSHTHTRRTHRGASPAEK